MTAPVTMSVAERVWIDLTNAAIRRIVARLPSPPDKMEVGHDEWLVMQEIDPEVAAVVFGYWRGMQMVVNNR